MTSATALANPKRVLIKYWENNDRKYRRPHKFFAQFLEFKTDELATLMALTPVVVLPISCLVSRKKWAGRRFWGSSLRLPELPSYFWHNWGMYFKS
jgi:hypothetical protein